ncbi:MFS transporter [Microbispora hainanensis]|jgi:hypothetical protein|uniref:MFS transporter n=1 Tax=Microbispora hainanensis TaxID=568844 RepID=A0ABZ1SJT3_9ACTN|nr:MULTISPECIES: MFS transporter [Microbispora]NJP25470.1 MFS transporter [Microbispora sp. CL1-1]TQS13431.1 MFS transporter [Microbispora sp. SCL1-1]
MFAGLAALLAGLICAVAVYPGASAGGYSWPLLAAPALGGAGNGLFTVPFFTTALSRVRAHETGSAAGLLNAVQQFGGTLGVAVLGTAFLHRFAADVRSHLGAGGAALGAIRLTFWIAAALVAVTAALMGVRKPLAEPAGH